MYAVDASSQKAEPSRLPRLQISSLFETAFMYTSVRLKGEARRVCSFDQFESCAVRAVRDRIWRVWKLRWLRCVRRREAATARRLARRADDRRRRADPRHAAR